MKSRGQQIWKKKQFFVFLQTEISSELSVGTYIEMWRTDIISKGDPSSVEIIYAIFFLFFFFFTAGLTKIENVFFDFSPTLFLAILFLALSLLALSLS